MEYWVKLHSQSLTNEVFMYDPTAWMVFMVCLLLAYPRKGEFTITRNQLAKHLDLKPITAYKALKRLEERKMIVLVTDPVTRRFTRVSILNWDKFQGADNTSSNLAVTSQEQRGNSAVTPYIDIDIDKEQLQTKKLNSLVLGRGQVIAFLKEFPGLTTTELEEQRVLCNRQMAMSSSEYTNPGLYFKGWLRTYMAEKNKPTPKHQTYTPPTLEDETPERREHIRQKLAEGKAKLLDKLGG